VGPFGGRGGGGAAKGRRGEGAKGPRERREKQELSVEAPGVGYKMFRGLSRKSGIGPLPGELGG
jgi:hypothetical protein